jgi:peptidoglycan hydrolase-like protein with peptidoglycan-binding domain
MSPVSYLRTAQAPGRLGRKGTGPLASQPRRRGPGRYVAAALVVGALGAVAVAAVLLISGQATLGSDPDALAKVGMPLGGGTIQSVTVTTGPHARRIPASVRGDRIWPTGLIRANEMVSIDVTVKRPGWVSWLAGSTKHLHLSLRTPATALRTHYLTLRAGAPLRLAFTQPIRMFAYGSPGHLRRRTLAQPQSAITLPRSADAGTVAVAAAPRTWETAGSSIVSWFPAGASASAVADPPPGSKILPNTSITLTFSKPISSALGAARPPVSPATPGVWHTVNSHTVTFRPEGTGYGLGATVNVALPNGVRLVGGQQSGSASTGVWTVPQGSPLRMQQLLAILGYLPLKFDYSGAAPGLSASEQLAAAISPPAGKFSWKYANTPSELRSFWQPGASGVMMKGALMAFENDHGLTADGVSGPNVWKALMAAAVVGHPSGFGYTFVMVSVSSQHLVLWHNGKTELTTAVNTGIASAPTATGTYPVYEHISSGTMSGTNPDGSHYSDPGIRYISYFNGGDALHAFTRAQYGFPQSLGCVEMPLGSAGAVYPYTPIGTLVHVA